jgi:hypothetical protein
MCSRSDRKRVILTGRQRNDHLEVKGIGCGEFLCLKDSAVRDD